MERCNQSEQTAYMYLLYNTYSALDNGHFLTRCTDNYQLRSKRVARPRLFPFIKAMSEIYGTTKSRCETNLNNVSSARVKLIEIGKNRAVIMTGGQLSDGVEKRAKSIRV